MSETFLKALIQFFALLTDVAEIEKKDTAQKLVLDYLTRHFSKEYAESYFSIYKHYLKEFHLNAFDEHVKDKKYAENNEKLTEICNQLNTEMEKGAKMLLLVQLLSFLRKEGSVGKTEYDHINNLAKYLLVSIDDYNNLKTFVLHNPEEITDKNALLLISGNKDDEKKGYKHIFNDRQVVTVWMLFLKDTQKIVFRYSGERNLYLNGYALEFDRTYVLAPGAVIKTSLMPPVYYTKVANMFLEEQKDTRIMYRAVDVEYKFNPELIAIHKFSLTGQSGQLIGVIGGSGTGKSTLLNVLNGSYKLSHGRITINGYDLNNDKEDLEGVIGFVPQTDLLIEELTVYENLYFNARLCFSEYSKSKIDEIVNTAIVDFDLVEAKNLVVGSPLKKILSGGQRKRLNIALELMREPSILFVDEPTSGLSSMDSEKVMTLLKRQAIKGRLVILNIHQPSSDLYKLFDKLLVVDKGGHIIHNGNPMDAIEYFKVEANYANPEERECPTCGNVKTEQPLRIVEARTVNPEGRLTRQRKIRPEEWYRRYWEKFEDNFHWKYSSDIDKKEELPPSKFKRPKRWEQFLIYFQRDALAKLKDSQYLLVNFLEAPLLAVILGFFTKYVVNPQEEGYVFANNVNIPAYLFMSILVALFLGMNVSAEEIIKDRKLLMREKFLNLSRSSYLNSKVVVLFLISAIQTLSFVLIGNFMLEIHGLTFSYWAILFTVSCFANMLGLNISSGLNSAVVIYILIPLILVPQILFSGVIVEFDKLHSLIASHTKVPTIGNIMVSRWGFEALAVNQFTNNEYEKHFFEYDLELSTNSYFATLLIPEVIARNDEAQWDIDHERKEAFTKNITVVKNELEHLRKITNVVPPNIIIDNYSKNDHFAINSYLQTIKQNFNNKYRKINSQKDAAYVELKKQLGSSDAIWKLRSDYQNNSLTDWVMLKKESKRVILHKGRFIRKKQPIYQIPEYNYGGAHFYAPYKFFAGIKVNTPLFNTITIWVFALFLYITLYYDVLRKANNYIEKLRMKRQARKMKQ